MYMFEFYVFGPLRSLVEHWPVKLVVSTTGMLGAGLLSHVIDGYSTLLETNGVLILAAASFFLLDLVSGLYGTVRYDHIDFSVSKLKRAGFKFVEWGLLILASVIFANSAQEAGISMLSKAHVGTILWLCVTDLFSILVNVKGSESGAMNFLRRIKALLKGNVALDDLDTDANNDK